jgi:archaellum component FlaC
MKDILTIVIPSIITAFVGWFIGRKKENIDLCGERLDALEKSITVYNTIIDDMAKKIETLTAEINKLETNKRLYENKTEKKKQTPLLNTIIELNSIRIFFKGVR